MKRRTKRIGLAVAAQVGCVAVGLWMHHRFTVSSVEHAAGERVWTDLEREADAHLADLRGFAPVDLTSRGAARRRLARLLDKQSPKQSEITLVDSQWRILSSTDPLHGTNASDSSAGAGIRWTPIPRAEGKPERFTRGVAQLPSGPHVAVAYTFPNGGGVALFHRPRATVAALTVSLLDALPMIGALTFVWICTLLGLAIYLVLAKLHDEIDQHRSQSAAETLRQTQALVRTRDAVIFGLAKLAESRDPETGDHLERISVYSTTLASVLRKHPKFRDEVTPAFVRLIGISSALHDIGKVGVADRILLKPGPLTSEERTAMQTHARIGGTCLQDIERRLGRSNFLQMAREIAFTHHENWDGSGYPNGLAGAAIPLAGRVVAIADVYDALSSKRVYKGAFGHDECVEIIRGDIGKKFDPDLIEIWLTIEQKFRRVAEQLRKPVPGAEPSLPFNFEAVGDEAEEAADRQPTPLEAANA